MQNFIISLVVSISLVYLIRRIWLTVSASPRTPAGAGVQVAVRRQIAIRNLKGSR